MTILRLFIKNALGCPIFEVASNPPAALHALFPSPATNPLAPFHIRFEPTTAEERIVDLSSVLNTKQIKAFDEHYVVLPGASKINEVVARGVYFHQEDSSLHDLLDASRRVLVKPYEILDHLTTHGYRYLGSHVEAYGRQGQICDVHTFLLETKPLEPPQQAWLPSPQARPWTRATPWISLENTRETHTIDEEEDEEHAEDQGFWPSGATGRDSGLLMVPPNAAGPSWTRRWQVPTMA